PLPAAPAADSEAQVLAQWNAVYDAYNEVACLILRTGVERFDLIQTFYACKQEEGKPLGLYVLKMKGYVEQLECLGYVLPQDISVGLILNGLTSDFARFVRNYNMHNMGKTIGELHALLIEYEKGLPKKATTLQVMAIQGGRIQKANKKLQNAKGKSNGKGEGKDKIYIPKPKNPKTSAKERPAKDDACHHCKEVGHWKRNCHVYLAELIMKKKQVYTASPLVSKNDVLYFNAISSNGIYEIDMINRVPNVNSIYTVSNKRAKHHLDSTYLWHCRLTHISKKRIEKLQHERLLKSTKEESFDKCVSCLSSKMTRKSFSHRTKRATDLLRIIHTNVFKNEVENQLEKTIKALRSYRGGEYISQEFKDYLKACGIVQELTPPYTPQRNRVSEKRNRTLLDMV
ncbi:retrotransposon protein, putative, ty1-copia subclass, partial [Tanacetum coccineum]